MVVYRRHDRSADAWLRRWDVREPLPRWCGATRPVDENRSIRTWREAYLTIVADAGFDQVRSSPASMNRQFMFIGCDFVHRRANPRPQIPGHDSEHRASSSRNSPSGRSRLDSLQTSLDLARLALFPLGAPFLLFESTFRGGGRLVHIPGGSPLHLWWWRLHCAIFSDGTWLP